MHSFRAGRRTPRWSDTVGRREFLHRALVVGGSLSAVGAMAQQRVPSHFDPSLESIAVAYRSTDGRMTTGYLSRPTANETAPGLIVVHDDRGLSDDIRGVARTTAAAGYFAIAPDFLSRAGSTASFRGVEADVQEALTQVTTDDIVADSGGTIAYMKRSGRLEDGKLGAIGVGWGGGAALLTAVQYPEVTACVMLDADPRQDADRLARLNAPLLAIFAGGDEATTESVPRFEEALKASARPYAIEVYPGVQRGFHAPSSGDRYNAEATKNAWTQILQHVGAYVNGDGR